MSFIIGLFVGGTLGAIIMAMVNVAAASDEEPFNVEVCDD